MIDNIMSTEYGSTIISIILGLGLAVMFKKVCKDGNCVIIKGPSPKEIQKNIYKIENNCYKYIPEVINCDKE
tara:strand:- start:812 stop:1027 length:216 start_codon:yes stop_codon:yes gene_type:complete